MAAVMEAGEWLIENIPEIKIAVISALDLLSSIEANLVETKNDSHAGEVETSIMLYLKPYLVKGVGKEEYPNFSKFILVKDKKRYWPGGIWGDPTKATKEKGERLFNHMVKGVIDLVRQIEGYK